MPSGVTAVEQRAVKEAGYQAGARRVYIIEEPMAAAIGAGPAGPRGHRQHGRRHRRRHHRGRGHLARRLVTTLSVRTAGDELDQAIVGVDEEGALPDARRAHRRGGQDDPRVGVPAAQESQAEIRGRDMVSGLPRTVTVSSAEIRKAIEEQLHAIVDAVRTTLDQTPPELAGDIMDRGIVLTGGGALLRGLDERMRHETGMPVHVAHNPLSSVALGAGKCVEEFEALQQVLVSETTPAVPDAARLGPAPGRPMAARAAGPTSDRGASRVVSRCWCSPR